MSGSQGLTPGGWQVARKCFVADLLPPHATFPARVWLQGVAVAAGLSPEEPDVRGFVLDDGTGLMLIDGRKLPTLSTPPSSSSSSSSSSASPPPPSVMPCPLGAYVMVIGSIIKREVDGARTVVAAKLVDLSSDPNRETMWYLEVVESSMRQA